LGFLFIEIRNYGSSATCRVNANLETPISTGEPRTYLGFVVLKNLSDQ